MTDDLFDDRAVRGQSLTRETVQALIARLAPGTGAGHLVDCDGDETDLSGLDLWGWTFERCSFRRAKFTGARLEGVKWLSCRGAFADFQGADLTDALFRGCDFNNGMFRRATLNSAAFAGCKLTGADLSEARTLHVRFEEVLLINAKLPGHSFRKLTLNRVDFGQADLRKCDFRDSVFEASSLRDANMAGCRFEGADLRGADLGGLRLVDAGRFRGATISREQAGQLLAELGLNVR
ncbi:MAG TPA: pentapeptide repeat-containing protein [Sphingobium sp.]